MEKEPKKPSARRLLREMTYRMLHRLPPKSKLVMEHQGHGHYVGRYIVDPKWYTRDDA